MDVRAKLAGQRILTPMLKLVAPLILLLSSIAAVLLTDSPAPPASYVVAERTDIFTLDPQRMEYNQDLRTCYAIYEGLARWDNDTFAILPAIAETWDVSEDRRTYTFHLRDDAKWSNGDPVRAHDFVYSWRRALMPDTAAAYSGMYFLIEGAENFFGWRSEQMAEYGKRGAGERTSEAAVALRRAAEAHFDETVGVRALDERTFEVRLVRPTSYFLDLCAFGPFYPVHPPTVEEWVSVDARSGRIEQRHDWTKPPLIVTNGPYVVARWRFKRDIRLERNPHYWQPEMVKSDSVEMRIIPNPGGAVLAYETGAVDWVEEVFVDYLPEMIEEQKQGERNNLIKTPNFGTYFWSFNCTEMLPDGRVNPFADARVRRAFAMCVNKKDIVEKVRRQGEPIADTLIPPGSIAGFDEGGSITGLAFDPAGGRALLGEAGWVDRDGDGIPENGDGEPFPMVELLYSTNSYHEDIALAMGAMWEEALGVRSRLAPKESKIYKDDLKKRNYMMARGGWYGDYGDPTTFLNIHRTGDGNNDRGYSDPHFDELLKRAEKAPDDSARMRLLEEAERYTTEETLPVLPLFSYVRYYMFDPETFTGISRHPRITQYLWELEKVK